MLPDRYTELLTAFVDGDLSSRQRRAVLKLLHRSSEARLVLKELQENAHALQNLPPKKLSADFADGVLHEIKVRGLQPGVAPPPPVPVPAIKRFPGWIRFAAAAAVLFVAAYGGYLLFTSDDESKTPGPGPIVEMPKPRDIKPDPMVNLLVAGAFKDFTLSELRLPPTQLAEPATQRVLAKEFEQNKSAVHFEWNTQNTGETMTRLHKALEAQARVVIDAHTKAMLAKPQTTFLVYAENLKADELTKILGQVGGNAGDHLVIGAITVDHRKQLFNLMGGGDEKKLQLFHPIQGPAPKVKNDKANPKQESPRDALAVVMALDNADPKARSAQVAEFFKLKSLRTPRPGTLQVMLVIQSA